mgnify:CR=1 FL=1
MIKKIALLFIFSILLSSCFTDVVDEPKVNTIDAKTLESFLNVNITKYAQINNSIQFPIVAWVGITYPNLSIENFQRMKEAGININCSRYPNIDSMQIALDLSFEVGIKTLIDCPELTNNTVETVNRFRNHPANAGYFLKDEPSANQLPYYSNLAKLIESIDNSRFCYINLLPTYAGSDVYGTSTYNEYIQSYTMEIPLKILSFDHYPIIGTNVRYDWYNNLEIVKDVTAKTNIPFWAFALTTAHNSYPVTDLNQLRLQIYSNLAYGAKGIQFFSYQTTLKNDYHMGPIERDGSKTVVYDYIKTINEEIHAISPIFLNSEVIKVSHYGDNIPEGTTPFISSPSNIISLKIRGGNALLSELKNEENSFFMIQNNNLFSEIGVKIETNEQTYVVSKKGYIIPAEVIDEEFKLEPGDIAIFMS